MTPKHCMVNLFADIIGLDDTYTANRLNEAAVWDRFMDEVFLRMETITDEAVRDALDSVDSDEFQVWIDDPDFWSAVNTEIDRRINVVKTLLPSTQEGHC